MSSDVMYKFGKSYYIQSNGDVYNECELIVVYAENGHGRYAYSFDQSRGTPRDYKNLSNTLAQAEDYIAERLGKISFRADESPEDARKKIDAFIDSKNQYRAFDASISNDINVYEKFYLGLQDSELYSQVLMALTRLEPVGVHAILTGGKYPFSAAAHDFAHGISHVPVKRNIEKLPKPLIGRLKAFAAQRNYVLSADACRTEVRNYKDDLLRTRPKVDRSPERIENITARAVDDMLRDALEYKYYKKTGNMGIFISSQVQRLIDQAPDSKMLNDYGLGWSAMQNYGAALQVVRRMEKIIAADRDITPFITELNKTLGDGYVNQEIIRMMYNTLSPHYNKFKKNKKVTEFISRLRYYVKDGHQAKRMAETFGLPDAPKPKKDKVRAELVAAAARIAAGDNVSGVVVLDKKIQLTRDFAVEATPETYALIKKSIRPTYVQRKILRKYGSRQK